MQYAEYLGDAVTLDLGTTLTDNRDGHLDHRRERHRDARADVLRVHVALVVGIPLGLLAGRYRDTSIDTGGRMFGIVVYAAPVFFTGLPAPAPVRQRARLVTDLGPREPDRRVRARRRPPTSISIDSLITGNWNAFWDVLEHLILPAVTLGLLVSGVLIRLVRVNLLQTMQGDYVEAARARGITERRVVIHHAFRNALVPVVTVAGLQFAILLGGASSPSRRSTGPGSAPSWSATSTTATTSPCRGSSPSSRSPWSSISRADRHGQRPHRPAGEVLMTAGRPAACSAAGTRRPIGCETAGRGVAEVDAAQRRSSIVARLPDPGDLRAADRPLRLRPGRVDDGVRFPKQAAPDSRRTSSAPRSSRPTCSRGSIWGARTAIEVVVLAVVFSLADRRPARAHLRLRRRLARPGPRPDHGRAVRLPLPAARDRDRLPALRHRSARASSRRRSRSPSSTSRSTSAWSATT